MQQPAGASAQRGQQVAAQAHPDQHRLGGQEGGHRGGVGRLHRRVVERCRQPPGPIGIPARRRPPIQRHHLGPMGGHGGGEAGQTNVGHRPLIEPEQAGRGLSHRGLEVAHPVTSTEPRPAWFGLVGSRHWAAQRAA